jgi:hypothetical protein
VDDRSFEGIKANLFPGSHGAIPDWNTFPWHRDKRGAIQTHKVQSSQALAIDVFGTIKVSRHKDRIVGALAERSGVATDGDWRVELEWTDEKGLLGEPTPTQADAVAFGPRSVLVIECKFTELGGGCSQPKPLGKGANQGKRQCTGKYAMQVNPVTGSEARCALSPKGVKYWDLIPDVYGLDKTADHIPCPFRGDAYQWMRNVLLATRLASESGGQGGVIAAYADGDSFATAAKVRAGKLGHPAASGKSLMEPISYQAIIALARAVSGEDSDWVALDTWVRRKIAAVAGR